MIDFHTHILAGIDDGAETIQHSVEMVKSLKSQGVNTILLTPHFYFSNISEDGFFAYRKKSLSELEEAVKDLNVNLIPACEVYLSKISLANNLNKFIIKGTKYILLELPHRTLLSNKIFDSISMIIDYLGLIPIIAHAERYPAVHSNPEIISELINMGCLIQLNTSSLFNKKFSRLAYKMLDLNQVHCIGTDCHNDKRPPVYTEAKNAIENRYGAEYFENLQKNMKAVLKNKELKKEEAKPIKKLFGFYV